MGLSPGIAREAAVATVVLLAIAPATVEFMEIVLNTMLDVELEYSLRVMRTAVMPAKLAGLLQLRVAPVLAAFKVAFAELGVTGGIYIRGKLLRASGPNKSPSNIGDNPKL